MRAPAFAVVSGGDDDVEDVDVPVAVDVAVRVVLKIRWFGAISSNHADDSRTCVAIDCSILGVS